LLEAQTIAFFPLMPRSMMRSPVGDGPA